MSKGEEAAEMSDRKECPLRWVVWSLARGEAWYLYFVFFNSLIIKGGSTARLDREDDLRSHCRQF